MAIEKTDIIARMVGGLFFLPIIGFVLSGYPWAMIGCAIAVIWTGIEIFYLLSKTHKRITLFCYLIALIAIFFIPLAISFISSTPIFLLYALALGGCLWAGILLIMRTQEKIFLSVFILAAVCLGYISSQPSPSILLLCAIAIITSGDIGSYLIGRIIGGAKLAPQISPSKTWAGSVGGIVMAVLICEILAYFFGLSLSAYARGLIVFSAILAQIGDLMESSFKRRIGVKNSSEIVPGHGGALDRFDGYLLVLPFLVLFDGFGLLPDFIH